MSSYAMQAASINVSQAAVSCWSCWFQWVCLLFISLSICVPSESPTVVNFHVWVLSLDSIDEGSMTYAADIFMSQSWDDARLRIPDSIMNFTSEYRLLPLSWLERMWRPDSFFKNAKQVVFQEMTIPNHYIWLYPNKRILYMVKLTLLLSCAMKFQSYPHDTQYCNLQIESLSYTTNELMFEWESLNPLIVGDGIELPQHNLISAKPDVCHQVYSSGESLHLFSVTLNHIFPSRALLLFHYWLSLVRLF